MSKCRERKSWFSRPISFNDKNTKLLHCYDLPRTTFCERLCFEKEMDKSKFLNLALAIGKVVRTDVTDRAHVLVQLNRFNPVIKTYFPGKDYLEAYNPENHAKIGDIVLIKKLDNVRKLIETHQITEIIYSAGFVTDPMTGLRVDGERYIHDNEIDNEAIRGLAESIKDVEHAQRLRPRRKLREFTHGEKI